MILRGHDCLTGAAGEFAVVACADCRLAFTRPRLSAADFERYYPETYSPYVPAERTRTRGELLERLRLEAIVRLGPYRQVWRRPPGRLLDVGCGTGDLARVFTRHGWQVSAVEPSAGAAEHARAAGVDALTGTLAEAPWPPAWFDAVIFNHSLEHVEDPALALSRAARLLRRGGLLAIAVPNFGSWQRRAFGSAWFQLDLPRHQQHFDRHTLTTLVERAGFTMLATGASSMRPSPLGSLQNLAFGEVRYEGRGFRLLSWAIAPFLALADRVAEGDCLHLIAQR